MAYRAAQKVMKKTRPRRYGKSPPVDREWLRHFPHGPTANPEIGEKIAPMPLAGHNLR